MFTASLPVFDILAQLTNPAPTAPPEFGARMSTIFGFVRWGVVIACAIGFMVAGAMLAYQRIGGGGGDAQGKLMGAMIGAGLSAAAVSIINVLAF